MCMYLNPGARCTLQNTMLSVRSLEVHIKFWRACYRDSCPFDQYIKSRQDLDKKGKMGVHQYRRACHPIKSDLQTLKDNILKAEKEKAMKDLGQQNHYTQEMSYH